MGVSLQIRENLSELLFSELYDTDDTDLLVERSRATKERPVPSGEPRENPLFRRILRSMKVKLDFSALRDYYFSSPMGRGNILIYPYKDTEYFLALDLHRDRLEDTDAVVLAVYCSAKKYVVLKDIFELLQKNSQMEVKLPVTEAPLIKAVLESDKKLVYYNGDKIPVADRKTLEELLCEGESLTWDPEKEKKPHEEHPAPEPAVKAEKKSSESAPKPEPKPKPKPAPRPEP